VAKNKEKQRTQKNERLNNEQEALQAVKQVVENPAEKRNEC
jgi:hypothetical protein